MVDVDSALRASAYSGKKKPRDGNREERKSTTLEPLKEKWESFGWNAIEIDGHDFNQLDKAFEESKKEIIKFINSVMDPKKPSRVPYLIEYNVRMGDPECQTILPKLKTDITDIFLACCQENLEKIDIEWTNKKSLCIVVCSKGYPEAFKKNVVIENLNKITLGKDEYLFHAGTLYKENKVYAVVGRVLNFVSLSEDLGSARYEIINNLDKLNWDGGFYRKDIGYKVID